MSTSLQFALSNPRSGMETAFNDWYGGSHMLHGVQTPGIISGQRFRRSAGPWPAGKHDYLMIWQLDDPAHALAELAKAKGSDSMPISPAIDMETVQPPTMWRRAELRSSARIANDTSTFGTVVLALYNAAEGCGAQFAQALLAGRLAEIADSAGVIAAHYLTLADEQIRGNCRKFPHGVLVELHDEAAGLAALAGPLATLPHADPDRWMAVVFRPLGRRFTRHDALATAPHA